MGRRCSLTAMNTPSPFEIDLAAPRAEATPPAENAPERVLWEMGLALAIPLLAAAAIELAFRVL